MIFSFSKFGLAEQQNTVPQETAEFINNINNILKNMGDKVNEKSEMVKRLPDSGNIKESYRAEAEITAIITGYRQQIEFLTAPSECVALKATIVKLMTLMEEMHASLSKRDIEQYKLLAPQVIEYSGKIQKEIQALQAYYKN